MRNTAIRKMRKLLAKATRRSAVEALFPKLEAMSLRIPYPESVQDQTPASRRPRALKRAFSGYSAKMGRRYNPWLSSLQEAK